MQKRLRHTNNSKNVMTSQEELFVSGWSIIDEEVTRLHNKSWAFQKRGKQVVADLHNEAANYHTYLFYYALFLRNKLDREGLIKDGCTSTMLNEETKIECVEKNLPCLSSNFNTDYVTVWKQLTEVFGIVRQTAGCETDCCVGIGDMIIGGEDDCSAFILGPCKEETDDTVEVGEYEDCAFDDGHAVADEGICDTTLNCK